MAAIFLASSDSDPPAPAQVPDKVLHMAAYGGLAITICRALAGGLPSRLSLRTVIVSLLATIAYGITDELHQMFVPERSPDVYDIAADAAGAAIGLIACWAWGIIRVSDTQLPGSTSAT